MKGFCVGISLIGSKEMIWKTAFDVSAFWAGYSTMPVNPANF